MAVRPPGAPRAAPPPPPAAAPPPPPAPAATSARAALLVLLLAATAVSPASPAAGSLDADRFFSRSPESVTAPLGDETTLECALRFPAERLRWRKDGRFLDTPHDPHDHPHAPALRSRLPLRLSDPRQAGVYQCVAWFGASALASLPARVTLAELQPFPIPMNGALPPARRVEVFEGSTIALRWPPPPSAPPAVLQYDKNGKPIPETSKTARVLESTGSLILMNVTAADAGEYRCTARNYITGQNVTAPDTVTLVVKPRSNPPTPPYLIPPSHPRYDVAIGNNITLECSGSGNPLPKVSWKKYGGELPKGRSHLVSGGLHVVTAMRSDGGTYTCTLTNGEGDDVTQVIELHVQERPTIARFPNSTTIQEGEDVSFECQAKGSPAPLVGWLFNGDSVPQDEHTRILGGRLQILSAEKRHAGTFQCFASNPLGDVSRSLMLRVAPKQIPAQPGMPDTPGDEETEEEDEDIPGRHTAPDSEEADRTPLPSTPMPGNRKKHHRGRKKDKRLRGNESDRMIPPSKPVVTRLSDTSVMVRWEVPSNEGMPIQFFKVQYRIAGHRNIRGGRGKSRGGPGRPDQRAGEVSRDWKTTNEDIPEHVRSYEVDNLHPDHVYRFRVAAVYANNDNKPGMISDRFKLVRGDSGSRLSAPKLLRVEPVSPSALRVHWAYSQAPGAPAQGFYVYYRPATTAGDYIQVTVEGESERNITLSHLAPDTSYEVKVQSFTQESASNFSVILSQKTLPQPTETPPATEPAVPAAGHTDISKGQLYIILWGVLGLLALLAGVLAAICVCKRRRLKRRKGAATDVQDKLGNSTGLPPDSAAVFALNSKNLYNGRLPQNGHHSTPISSIINITTNPLAEDEDKNQNVVEMSSQNNNRSNASGSTTRNSFGVATEGDGDPQVDLDPARGEARSWRTIPSPASEKYV